ncbi:MAG: hypothetical protein H7312_16585 [Tardiphaga sp.]|nr:hypothetical protein [Tardiphaga sp.]
MSTISHADRLLVTIAESGRIASALLRKLILDSLKISARDVSIPLGRDFRQSVARKAQTAAEVSAWVM